MGDGVRRARLAQYMPAVSRALRRGDRETARKVVLEALAGPEVDAVLDGLGIEPRTLDPDGVGPLTRTEYVVLWAAACGLTTEETAVRYGRAFTTVQTHRKNIRFKLGCPTMASAIAEAFRRGIFDPLDELEPLGSSYWP